MAILTVLAGVFKFFDEVTVLVKLLEKTPEQKREQIMEKIRAEAETLKETGRPTW